ncbi:hypothetical protein [Salegentibacter flavus]|uniref:Uncharacterized protein n=1 Tax=Salegentibacter flavus TaxID=287099 RepID=A0A1I5DBQ3_9FLAO|nr:hypothetical protein [Salegentibacter flavus]SFN96694.1 hypothetical protein SAMN05660413_03268 [Salegentibacter flavus]
MSFDIIKYLTTIGFIYIYGRLVLHYGSFFLSYMLDQGVYWKSNFEKPRLLFLGLGLGLMHLMAYSLNSIEANSSFLPVIILIVFSLGFYLSIIPWTDKFKKNVQNQKSVNSLETNNNFNLVISDDQLKMLYQGLMRYDLLNSEKTSLQDFKNVLTKNWDDHNSKIQLNMDGPSTREFYDHLSKAFPNNTMTMKELFINSKLILRSDGKRYNYNTLKNALSRTPVSKNNEILISIFKRLK